jgi:uncharacterized membrane protein YphA (DoxX/SURF4 family)
MRRVAFRIGVVFAVLVMFPFPLTALPWTQRLAMWLHEPIRWGVNALAAILGIPEPSTRMTGSGDTMFAYLEVLLLALVAIAVAIGWTAVDRTSDDARVARALRIVLRWWLAMVLVSYGLAKVFEIQFREPPAWILDQRVGDKSPMGFLWTFMGHSRPYTIGAGLAECVGAWLLLWRRTATIGALVIAIVMTNVVAMNFCYDVPVKLYSLELLAAALAVAAPDLRRMMIAALGRATREVEPPPRTLWMERTGRALRLLYVVWVVVFAVSLSALPGRFAPASELDGAWDAQNDPRWARFLVGQGIAVIRTPTEQRTYFRAAIDPAKHTIVLDAPLRHGELGYELRDPDHLVVRGTINETWYEVTLVRTPPWLLESRGFHWIQEEPFNR